MAGSKGSSKTVDLGYRPRPHQDRAHRERTRFCILPWHRRAGKTIFCLAELVDAALRKPGAVLAYIAPTRQQARSILWSILKEYVRPIPGVQPFEAELRVVFPNGSAIGLYGALDGADSMRGLGLDLAVLDEFGLMEASVFPSVIRPALADRAGGAIFIGTFQGKDALFRLMESTRDLPDWSCFIVKASESGVLPPEELAAARATMPPDAYAREFECDPSASPPGSIFGALLSQMRQAGRVVPLPFVEQAELVAAMDLGIADSTSALVFQKVGRELRIVWSREWSGVGLAGVGKTLQELGVRTLVLPHDAEVREFVSGRTRRESLESMGFTTIIAPRVSLEEGIAAAAALLPHVCIDSVHATSLLDALDGYRRELRPDGAYGAPIHDRWSHSADALRYLALAVSDSAGDVFADERGAVYRRSNIHRTVMSDGTVREFPRR